MKDLVIDISYRIACLIFAVALIYMLPTLARLLGDFATAFFVPLLETTLQNMSS